MSLTLTPALHGQASSLRDTVRRREKRGVLFEFKLDGLLKILVRRGTISREDSYAFCVAHHLNTPLANGLLRDRMISANSVSNRAISRILADRVYFENIQRQYKNHLLPFLEKTPWTYFVLHGAPSL